MYRKLNFYQKCNIQSRKGMRQINSSIMVYIPVSQKEELILIKCIQTSVKHPLVQRRRSERHHTTTLLS